jgi:hypothetical protein
MSNNLVGDSEEKRCELCGSNGTYIALTKDGRPYPKWNKNPSKEESWKCGRCYMTLVQGGKPKKELK